MLIQKVLNGSQVKKTIRIQPRQRGKVRNMQTENEGNYWKVRKSGERKVEKVGKVGKKDKGVIFKI